MWKGAADALYQPEEMVDTESAPPGASIVHGAWEEECGQRVRARGRDAVGCWGGCRSVECRLRGAA